MFPNLVEPTKRYWRQLDELEAAYQKGEVSLEEVDARVPELIAELGQARREAWFYFLGSWNRMWNEQKEAIVGIALLGILTYTWLVVSSA